jgi:deazaflavin-dependent oxidoreductase (nitroreductase family)
MKRGWFWLLKHTLNRATLRAAKRGRGPFSIVRHVGRKTGKTYETPLILARLGDDFVAELTYGTEVQWYQNVVAAGLCAVVYHGDEYQINGIHPLDREDGLRAFGYPAALVLRLLRRHEFRVLSLAPPSPSGPRRSAPQS